MNNFFPKTTIVNISNRNRQCFGRTKRQFSSVYYICPKNDNFLHPKLGIRPKTTLDNKKLKWQKTSFKASPRMICRLGKGTPLPRINVDRLQSNSDIQDWPKRQHWEVVLGLLPPLVLGLLPIPVLGLLPKMVLGLVPKVVLGLLPMGDEIWKK